LSKPPRFQTKFYKELFPGTDLAGIQFTAYIDMIAPSKNSLGNMIVDIKTSGVALDETPGILALDQQLRSYAWVTNTPDVAFLWLQKVNRNLERGDEVSILSAVERGDGSGGFAPGDSAFIIKYQAFEPAQPADPEKPKSKPKPEVPEEVWIVWSQKIITEMFKVCGKGQTKAEKEKRDEFIHTHAVLVPKDLITKQRIQFLTAHISLNDQLEASKQIGQDAAQIAFASQENFWPKQGGVRFPNNKCSGCPMLGNCLGDAKLRDTLVYRNEAGWE
jgi:hypothetical protein